jgi:hypothetical protein
VEFMKFGNIGGAVCFAVLLLACDNQNRDVAAAAALPQPADRYVGEWTRVNHPDVHISIKKEGAGFVVSSHRDGERPESYIGLIQNEVLHMKAPDWELDILYIPSTDRLAMQKGTEIVEYERVRTTQ